MIRCDYCYRRRRTALPLIGRRWACVDCYERYDLSDQQATPTQ